MPRPKSKKVMEEEEDSYSESEQEEEENGVEDDEGDDESCDENEEESESDNEPPVKQKGKGKEKSKSKAKGGKSKEKSKSSSKDNKAKNVQITMSIPNGTIPITSDPFDEANSVPFEVNMRFCFNPTKQGSAPLEIDIAAYIIEALEQAHLVFPSEKDGSWAKVDPKTINFLLCNASVIGAYLNTLPFPVRINLDLPVPFKPCKFVDQISKETDAKRELLRKMNEYNVILNETSEGTMNNCFAQYKPRQVVKEKIEKYGKVMSGTTTVWGDKPIQIDDQWLVIESSPGVEALQKMTGDKKPLIKKSQDNPGKVWIQDKDKKSIDERWEKTRKSWGTLDHFNLIEKKKVMVTIARSDIFIKNEKPDADHWTSFEKTQYEHLDAQSQKDLLDKNHCVAFNIRGRLGTFYKTNSNGN